MWKENRRRFDRVTPTLDLIRTYPSDYRVVFVGDASMSPYEITMPGGSVEHWNEEAGQPGWSASSPTSPSGLAQPDSREALGLHPFHRVGPQAPPRPHVSPDARGHRSRDARAGALTVRGRERTAEAPPLPGLADAGYRAHARDLQPRSPSVGGPVTFALDGDRLTVDSGRKVEDVRLAAVEQVRMTYESRGFSQRAFQTKVRLKDGKSFRFSSRHWKSLVEAERLDGPYRAFTRALLEAIAASNPQARFLAGRPGGSGGATSLGGAALAGIACSSSAPSGAAIQRRALIGRRSFALGIWQLEPMIRLNKPRRFAPDAPPAELLP